MALNKFKATSTAILSATGLKKSKMQVNKILRTFNLKFLKTSYNQT